MCAKIALFALCLVGSFSASTSWSSSSISSLFRSTGLPLSNLEMNADLLDSVALGIQMAMDGCKEVFKWDRWNCPQSSFSRRVKHSPTREQAYSDAIIAAGIIYSITRNCSRGELKGCSCDPHSSQTQISSELIDSKPPSSSQTKMKPVAKDWTWGGCSDDTGFGEDVVLSYLKDDEKHSDPQAFSYRHNNKIGSEIVRKTMIKTCKCHGVSGSCSLQTCWMQMVPFSEIAKQLRDKYNNAIQISFEEVDGAVPLGNSARQLPLMAAVGTLPDNLVYLDESPDFCVSNNATGWPGTKGRSCSRSNLEKASVEEKRSCKNLCRSCGFKVKKQKRTVTHRCDCVFNWCCEVKCKTCVEKIEDYFCD